MPQARDGRFYRPGLLIRGATNVRSRRWWRRWRRCTSGVWTRKSLPSCLTRGQAITEECAATAFSTRASPRSGHAARSWDHAINNESLAQFAGRRRSETLPCLILDARYEKIRETGVIARPGGADRDQRRLRWLPASARRRVSQPREPAKLGATSSWARPMAQPTSAAMIALHARLGERRQRRAGADQALLESEECRRADEPLLRAAARATRNSTCVGT